MKLLKNKQWTAGIILAVLLTAYILFGIKAVLFFTVFALIVFPFYLLLGLFELETAERTIFSVFIGIGLFSSLVYWAGFLFSSLKIAAIAVFFLLIGYWLLFDKVYSPNRFKEEVILLGLFSIVFLIGFIVKATIINNIAIPEHIAAYLECLKNNANDYCSKLVKYMKF